MSSEVTEPCRVPTAPAAAPPILVVSGMSGAGKTSALKCLEDMGYEAIDNIPIGFLATLLTSGHTIREGQANPSGIAIGVDARTRDFRPGALIREIERLKKQCPEIQLMFLDCDDDELGRRYSETRHRHPLAQDRPISDGIQLERELMSQVRDRADFVIDTSGLGPGRLKGILTRHLGLKTEVGLAVFVTSFSYRRGLPREADLVFDVRFLANPHYEDELRPLTGRDPAVQRYISADSGYADFFARLTGLLGLLLPRYSDEGKSYLTIAFGCTGGRHRSVFVAEAIADWLERQGHRVGLRHREIDRDDTGA